MSVEVIAIGGYQEVGKNMTAVKIGDDVIIFDMGIHLDRISMHEDTDIDRMHSLDLIERGVIPDDTLMKDVDGKVKGIVFSHGHLDHIGAVAKLAHRYDAPLIGTPYTAALIEKQIKGERKFKVTNPIKVLNPGSKVKLSKDITLEFVQSTHSIPQAVFPVLHTSEGTIVYALDFKFDNHQKVSPPPDYKRLKDRIAYHCNTNARGYIAENGMNFMRALQVVKQLHESGYSYNEIEYTLDKTVEQLGGFWGIKQVTNRIDVIVAKKRDIEQKSQLYKDKSTKEEVVDLRNLINNDWSEDEW